MFQAKFKSNEQLETLTLLINYNPKYFFRKPKFRIYWNKILIIPKYLFPDPQSHYSNKEFILQNLKIKQAYCI